MSPSVRLVRERAPSPPPLRHAERVPTDHEVTFGEEEIIVSKTDLKGIITYANPVFCRVAGYSQQELLGQPHNIIRHPLMPRGVFQVLWDTIGKGDEIFAYVINMTKTGDFYWVFAHVTPTFDLENNIVSYHSMRRCADPKAIAKIKPVYAAMLEVEAKHPRRADGIAASIAFLQEQLKKLGVTYEQLVFSL